MGGEFGGADLRGREGPRPHRALGLDGGGKRGTSYGAIDEFGLSMIKDRVHVRDLHTTDLHLMSLGHEKLKFATASAINSSPRSRNTRNN